MSKKSTKKESGISKKQHLLSLLGRAISACEKASLTELKNAVSQVETALSAGQLITLLVGEFSSGKSSLVNVLLRNNVLPTAIEPTTFTINEIYFSRDSEKIEIFSDSGKIKEIQELVDLSQIKEYKEANLVRFTVQLMMLQKSLS